MKNDDEGFEGDELAAELAPAVNGLLTARLVRLSGELNVDLGVHSIEETGFAAPRRPLLFQVQAIGAVRAVAETAVDNLPAADFDDEGVALLAQEGDLISTAVQAPSATLFTLATSNGEAVVHLPAGEAAAMVRVLAAAELELVGLGVLSRPGRLH